MIPKFHVVVRGEVNLSKEREFLAGNDYWGLIVDGLNIDWKRIQGEVGPNACWVVANF